MSERLRAGIPIWVARICWIVVLAFGSGALDTIGGGESNTGRWLVTIVLGGLWLIGLGALAFQSTPTLTITRIVVPLSAPTCIWMLAATTSSGTARGSVLNDAVIASIASVVAAVVVFSGDLGASYVQASAYGAEQRSLLRPPPVYLALVAVHWLVTTAVLLLGLEYARRGRAAIGVAALLVAAGLVLLGRSRWHRLSRRWLVLVPAGVVVHDHLVLAETLMLPKRTLLGVGVAPSQSDALDLTGDGVGSTVEIHTAELETVMLAARPGEVTGRAVHAQAIIVCPTRPGTFLQRARLGGLATGRVVDTSGPESDGPRMDATQPGR